MGIDPAADEAFMGQAMAQARLAQRLGEVPVGAVVTRGGQLVAAAHNAPIATSDPSAHAEIRALRAAGRALGNYRLVDCTLYVTLEPCPMCVGAAIHARLGRLVYGAPDPRTGAAGTVFDLLEAPSHNHRVSCTGGVLADAAGEMLRDFFRARRATRSGQ